MEDTPLTAPEYLRPTGDEVDYSLTDAQVARVVHEANRALQVEQADPTIGASPSWDDLDDETRRSAIQGIRGIRSGVVSDAKTSHENWMQFKIDNGWTLGPVKDSEKKEHPLLIPYEDLPESQRIKDDLFGAIVRALS